jgi:hypothetical protein
MTCSLVDHYQRFGKAPALHLQGRRISSRVEKVSSNVGKGENWDRGLENSARLHGVTSWTIVVLVAM